jgi:hypothetical protein
MDEPRRALVRVLGLRDADRHRIAAGMGQAVPGVPGATRQLASVAPVGARGSVCLRRDSARPLVAGCANDPTG